MSRTATGWRTTDVRCDTCPKGYVQERIVMDYSAQRDRAVRKDLQTRCSIADCRSNYRRH